MIAPKRAAPTAPVNTTLPAVPAVKLRFWPAPVRVELNVIFPPVDPVLTSTAPVSVVAPVKVTLSAEVAMLPAV